MLYYTKFQVRDSSTLREGSAIPSAGTTVYILMRSVVIPCLYLILAAPAATVLNAQKVPQDLITDRPDQTESAATVAPGYLQIEAGWALSRELRPQVTTTAIQTPGTLLRFGIVKALEGRLGFAGWMHHRTTDRGFRNTSSGMGDLDAGLKYQLFGGRGIIPAVALLAGTTLPTGHDGFGSNKADPRLRLILANDLSPVFSLGSNLGVEWNTTPGPAGSATLADFLYTFVVGIGVTNRVSFFAESFGTVPLETGSDAGHSLDGGVTFLVIPNLQFDVSTGFGLNEAADDWFVGAGLSVRIPR